MRALSDSYHRARRAYGFASGALAAWMLIGVDVDGAPVEMVNVVLGWPEVVPGVLVLLLGYFAFRLTNAWFQEPEAWRQRTASRVDFWVMHGLALLAFCAWFWPTVLGLALADTLNHPYALYLAFGLPAGAGMAVMACERRIGNLGRLSGRVHWWLPFYPLFYTLLFGLGVGVLVRIFRLGLGSGPGLALGGLAAVLAFFGIRQLLRGYLRQFSASVPYPRYYRLGDASDLYVLGRDRTGKVMTYKLENGLLRRVPNGVDFEARGLAVPRIEAEEIVRGDTLPLPVAEEMAGS